MPDPKTTSPATNPEARVDPTDYLHPQTLSRLETFELRARMIVEGVMSGMHRSPYFGFSVEFAQHRPYVPGDDLRHLDWKVFGRTERLYLKQYEQETNLDLILLVDASGSMNFGSRSYASASGTGAERSNDGRSNWTKFDHATATAAALSFVSIRQGDRVGLAVYADEILAMAARSSAQGQWRRIVSTLATHPVDKPTDFGRVVDQMLAKLNNRCLIVLVSDFFEDPEKLRTALARIRHRSHDAILLQVVDKREVDFDFDQTAPFEGLEGEGRLRLDPRAIRKEYLQAFNTHRDAVEKAARAFGFDYRLVNTHDWLGPPLAAFLARRNAQSKRSGPKR
ncbi:MAG: DUF58 domain-containing protein [Phycisphaeraceae bacterium]|nr:MAG: DUF58 domain-containing protein [Phycisphaeraceae bacterium]